MNRVATVVEPPTAYNTPIKSGDEILVHHNVFRRWYDQRQKEKNTSSYIDDNNFAVYWDQVFAYKRDGKWTSDPRFIFVEPILEETRWERLREVPLKGVVTMDNVHGLEIGQVVGFSPESEYEFRFEDRRYYRIYFNDITILHDGLKEGETANYKFRTSGVEAVR